MYHSTPSTPGTAGKVPAKKQKTIQTNATISFHNLSPEKNKWGIEPPNASSKVKPVLKVQMQLKGRDIETLREEVKSMRFDLVPNLFNTMGQAKIVNTKWYANPPNGPAHCIGPIPTKEIASSLATSLIAEFPDALPNVTADDMTIHPDLVMMDKPKMTVVVSDKKRDLSGELYPMSIFVVLNDEVKVLQVKVKLFFPELSNNLFGEDPDDMYQALIMLYNENKMETLVGFYKTHGFDVYISEELRAPKRKAVDELN